VADIISIDGKLADAKEQKAARIRKRKIKAVRKVYQCTHCAYKCEKCGTQLTNEEQLRENLRVPYRLCESCGEEYIDYIERHKGGGDPECYWRNNSWMDLWRCWIDYQGAVNRYMKSKEFLKLLQELKQQTPEE
jgi:hypothetical protein